MTISRNLNRRKKRNYVLFNATTGRFYKCRQYYDIHTTKFRKYARGFPSYIAALSMQRRLRAARIGAQEFVIQTRYIDNNARILGVDDA